MLFSAVQFDNHSRDGMFIETGREMNQELHIACIRNEAKKALHIIQTEALPASYINECLASAVLHGNIEVLSSVVEAPKIDSRIFDVTALLEKSVGLKQYEIITYLVGHPSIGELDLNVVLYSRGWQEYEPLKRKVDHFFKLICQTNQQNLWHQASLGRLDVVKHIVESKTTTISTLLCSLQPLATRWKLLPTSSRRRAPSSDMSKSESCWLKLPTNLNSGWRRRFFTRI